MPYHRRKNNRRRANGAEDKVARRAKHRKSAKAQSKQIVSLAKSINHIKHELKDQTVPVMWENNLQQTSLLRNAALGGANLSPYNKTSNIVVIPITSVGNPEKGAIPNTQVGASFPSLVGGAAHIPVQPYGRDIGETNQPQTGASWVKLYNQTVHMCFRQNDMTIPCRYKLYVVRLAKPEDGSSLDSTMLSLRKNIDGIGFNGFPSSNTSFKQEEDFYASDGYLPASSGSPGAIDTLGCALGSLNPNRYKVEHSRSFVLGPMPRTVASSSQVVPPQYGAVLSTPEARDYFECKFKINYGGVRLAAPNSSDDTSTKELTQTIMDIEYKDIRPDILRWVVIMPDRTTIEGNNDLYGCPVYTLRSTISSRVPA